ncbi:MAG TPA: hypothetical protein DCS97_01180, partial [Planctomycetes bacterium]|nr:hypothetical protein [Planctomycetota bacterium]
GDAANKTVVIALLDDAVVEGSETFAVNLSNAAGAALGTTTAATVTIADNEVAVNQAPVAQNQAISAVSGMGVSISLLMADADGPGPYSYTITAQPTHGTLVGSAGNNDWTYTPTAGYVGSDSFTWTVSDGALTSNAAVCSLTVNSASTGGRFQEAGGLLVMEAENKTAASANGDSVQWSEATSTAGYSGTGFLTTTDTGRANAVWSTGCEASYDATIATAGTYTVWLRVSAPDGAGDSVFAGVDGAQIGTSFLSTGSPTSFGWVKLATTKTLTAGDHTFSLRRREDGYRIDRILLSANASYVPSGVGPAESLRSGTVDTTAPAWIATWPTVNSITSSGFTVRAKTNEVGTAYYVVVASAAAAPSSAQVKAGVAYGGVTIVASGSLTLAANTEATKAVGGLVANTAYAVYVVAQDGVPNLQAAPIKVTAATAAVVGTTSWKINFQPAAAAPFAGYQVDDGSVYGDRGNGSTYGWATVNTANTRDRNAATSIDQRYDTLNHLQKTTGQGWSLAVPNGTYEVHLVCGDPSYTDTVNTIAIEGSVSTDPDGQDNFDEYTVQVTVSDGRLNIAPGTGAINAKLSFIEVSLVPTAGG